MAVEIVMPRLSDSMEEGTIVQWFVSQGDTVRKGDPLLEVETDKATVTYEAEADGTVLALSAEAGESVAVFAVIGAIGAPGEAAPVPERAQASGAANAGAEATGASGSAGAPPASSTATAPAAPAASAAPTASPGSGNGTRVKASPLARRIAATLGIDLAALVGTGPQGRVVRADVERHAAAQREVAAGPGGAGPAEGSAKGTTAREELSRLQRTIARRMSESRATVPDFELRCEVDMTNAVQLRGDLAGVTERPPSYNDMIVKAVAIALGEFPRVNGSYRDGGFERYSRINVGIAVAADDALVVPTIHDANRRSLGELAEASRALAAKVRDGSISPAELSGATFTVSNLGMFGVDSFSAVIDSPQAAILAVGALKPRPVVDADGVTLVASPTVQLSLACDHRILYGADGARFLARVRELLEQPLGLLL